MKKAKILENLSLKILAVFISILLWLIVINVSDPVSDTSYSDIPLTVVNADSITSQGKVYDITSDDTVSISVSAKRSILDSLGKDNFKAILDLSQYNENTGLVPVRIESNKYNDQIDSMKSKTENVAVSVEDKLAKQFVITPVITGEPEEGYVTGDVTTAENIIRISGAQSVVSAIKKVTAEVSVAGLSNSINTSVDLRLYDENGDLIKDTNLTKNISTVAVSVQILATKELPLKFNYSGEPAEGYCVSGELTSDVESVMVAGRASVLSSMSVLEVAAAAVNVDGMSQTTKVPVTIARYLPEGISLISEDVETVNVTVPIERIITNTYTLDKKNITMQNLPDTLEAEILGASDTIDVDLTGIASVMNSVGVRSLTLKATVDWEKYMEEAELADLSAGTYRVTLTFALPDGVSVDRDITISVRLTDIEEE